MTHVHLSTTRTTRAFTLIELLVLLAIMGLLISLLLSAVQAAREQSRRIACCDHLRQQALALLAVHESEGKLPFGNDRLALRDQAWSSAILTHLEQVTLAEQWDRSKPWNDTRGNLALSATVIAVYRCPSSLLEQPGDIDYGGIKGSALASEHSIESVDINNGVLVGSSPLRLRPVRFAEISDGVSNTLLIAEVADRLPAEHGLWADGKNAISHDNGGINLPGSGEIFSHHPRGAQVAFADGSVSFVSDSIDTLTLGALCSRSGDELIDRTHL